MSKPFVIGIGGTTRPGSSTECLVRAVLAECAVIGADTQMFGGTDLLALPHYVPESAERTPEQRALVDAVRRADAFVIGTPGYHGSVSALVKNAIDLLEDTRGDARVYLDGCPVGLIVSAAGWQASGVTMSAIRDIVHALRGWPTPIGITINSIVQKPFDAEGKLADEGIAATVRAQAQQVMRLAGTAAVRG
jgi:FMN reductase